MKGSPTWTLGRFCSEPSCEFFAGHGGAVDAVAAGLGAYIDDGVAGAAGLGVEDLVLADQAEREGVDQRVAAVAGLELGFAAEVGDAEAVAVAGDAADHAFDDGVVFAAELASSGSALVERAEAERIHDGERARAHGEDVAQNAADAGGRALERLDVAGVIVGFDLEGAGPAVADVDDAGVLARTLHDASRLRVFGGQALEVDAAGLVGAVLAPHHAVNAEFSEAGRASERRFDALVLVRSDAVLLEQLRGNRRWGGDLKWLLNLRVGHGSLVRLSHGQSGFAVLRWLLNGAPERRGPTLRRRRRQSRRFRESASGLRQGRVRRGGRRI